MCVYCFLAIYMNYIAELVHLEPKFILIKKNFFLKNGNVKHRTLRDIKIHQFSLVEVWLDINIFMYT